MRRLAVLVCLAASGCAPLPCVMGQSGMGGCPPDTAGGRAQIAQDAVTCASYGYAEGTPEMAGCKERFALQRVGSPFRPPGMLFLNR